jgi:hypothetical protein
MSTKIDVTPISVQRVRKTQTINLIYDVTTGALLQLIASRLTTIQQNGVDITMPSYSSFTLSAAQIPGPIATQLAALAARVDQLDNAP